MMTAMVFASHHESDVGKAPLKTQQKTRWKRTTVVAKSQHSFVRLTTYHRPAALKP